MAKLTVEEKIVKINDYKNDYKTEENILKISMGNRKCKIPYFSIPPMISCGSKKECFEYCYACKAFMAYPTVRKRLSENLQAANSDDFKTLMTEELKKVKGGLFRIHESGDFQNQKMIDNWYSIINNHPKITFYAYTKRLDLKFNIDKPKNFVLLHSSEKEKENKNEMKKLGFDKITKVINKESDSKKDEFVCKGGVNSTIKCGTTCKLCFTKTKKTQVINFIKH